MAKLLGLIIIMVLLIGCDPGLNISINKSGKMSFYFCRVNSQRAPVRNIIVRDINENDTVICQMIHDASSKHDTSMTTWNYGDKVNNFIVEGCNTLKHNHKYEIIATLGNNMVSSKFIYTNNNEYIEIENSCNVKI